MAAAVAAWQLAPPPFQGGCPGEGARETQKNFQAIY